MPASFINIRPAEMFFDRKKVQRGVDRAKLKAFGKWGTFVRREARALIKPAPRKTLKSMTPDELGQFRKREAIAEKFGLKKPKRPQVETPTKAGDPPRDQTGLLRKFIFFGLDRSNGDNVVAGPVPVGKNRTAHLLEYGGRGSIERPGGTFQLVTFQGNPFMQPAEEKVRPRVPRLFQDAIAA